MIQQITFILFFTSLLVFWVFWHLFLQKICITVFMHSSLLVCIPKISQILYLPFLLQDWKFCKESQDIKKFNYESLKTLTLWKKFVDSDLSSKFVDSIWRSPLYPLKKPNFNICYSSLISNGEIRLNCTW